jgi:hypothetical protein
VGRGRWRSRRRSLRRRREPSGGVGKERKGVARGAPRRRSGGGRRSGVRAARAWARGANPAVNPALNPALNLGEIRARCGVRGGRSCRGSGRRGRVGRARAFPREMRARRRSRVVAWAFRNFPRPGRDAFLDAAAGAGPQTGTESDDSLERKKSALERARGGCDRVCRGLSAAVCKTCRSLRLFRLSVPHAWDPPAARLYHDSAGRVARCVSTCSVAGRVDCPSGPGCRRCAAVDQDRWPASAGRLAAPSWRRSCATCASRAA